MALGDFRTELNVLQKVHHPHTVRPGAGRAGGRVGGRAGGGEAAAVLLRRPARLGISDVVFDFRLSQMDIPQVTENWLSGSLLLRPIK